MRRLLPSFLVLAALLGSVAPARGAEAELVAIGNRTGLGAVDPALLRAIFRGEQAIWPSQEAVVVVLPSSRAPFSDRFAQEILQLTRNAMQRHWLALVFQGRARAPVFLDSAPAIVDFVRDTPGAIAMVPADVTGLPRELVIAPRR